jgi:hypothetical protein
VTKEMAVGKANVLFREDNIQVLLLKTILGPKVLMWFRKGFLKKESGLLVFSHFLIFFKAVVDIFRKVVTGQTGQASEKVIAEFCLSIIKSLVKQMKLCPPELTLALNLIVLEAKVEALKFHTN